MENYKLEPSFLNSTINFEESLNPQQLQAIYETDGPCLVLAGAGSGKTRVLIYRLAYLLKKGVSPKNILLATFTNRASKEMIHRAETLLKSDLSDLCAGTFHHIGHLVLRKEAYILGYSSNFTIVDSEDAKNLITECFEDLGVDRKNKMFPKKGIIYNIYSLAASSQQSIDQVLFKFYVHLEEFTSPIKQVISLYNTKKSETNVMDFTDLLTNWLKILQIPELCEKYSQTYQYVLIDEYQDTNRLQFEIIKLLSSCHKNILAVGDDAQSIYSFRAADINNLLNFPKHFENKKIFKLQTNYRSSPEILSLANEIIKNNMNQFHKQLEAVCNSGEIPHIVETKDVYQQARFVTQRSIELNREGIPLNEIAVLFRSRFQALELEMELLKRDVPYIIRGGLKFFEQSHIKDTISYLKITCNPKDEISFKRAICLHNGIGRGFANKVWNKLNKEKKSLLEIERSLPKKPQEGFAEFSDIYDSLKTIINPKEALKRILKFYRNYILVSFDNPNERILDLEELAKMGANYPNILDFLNALGAFEDFKGERNNNPTGHENTLILSTIHQSKGLEWKVVFLIGFCDSDFPHPKALVSQNSLEEERRLFYVATTRAKSILYITYPQTKYTFKNGIISTQPSMFFYELPKHTYDEMIIQER